MNNIQIIIYKITNKRLLHVFVLAYLLLFITSAFADLSLDLSVPKNEYLIDEPIYATISLYNSGTTDTSVMSILDPNCETLRTIISTPDGESRYLMPLSRISIASNSLEKGIINLPPRESFSSTIIIRYDILNKKIVSLFNKPGEYEIQSVYTPLDGLGLDTKPIYSNKINITVIEPAGTDKIVNQLLHDDPSTLSDGIWYTSDYKISCFENIISKYSDSNYAIYAKLFLAEDKESSIAWKLRGTYEGIESVRKAAYLFEDIARSTNINELRAYALQHAGSSYAKMDDTSKALAMFEEMFLLPNATDDDRLKAILCIGKLESGEYKRISGINNSDQAELELSLPLRKFASILKFNIKWDTTNKVASISSGKTKVVLNMHKHPITINGNPVTGPEVYIKDNNILVSPSFIASLIAERDGKGMKNILGSMLAKSMETESSK